MRKKSHVEASCYDLAVQRLEKCYDYFDHIAVSFSGGKDSTACLNIALDVARRRGRLPLHVYTFDEEAIPPETVEYMQRVSENPEIKFDWFCLPVEHKNACSDKEPTWYCWHPDDRHKWCRELPPSAITHLDGFKHGMAIPDAAPLVCGQSFGRVCMILGIRAQESLWRFRSIACKPKHITDDCFLSSDSEHKWITKAYPIYDWDSEDVWRAPAIMGWDYNKAYDVMEKAGLTINQQRCAPPFGAQPIKGLAKFKTCWPELWAKMIGRVRGAATAARYANTDLYGVAIKSLPETYKSWRDMTMHMLDRVRESDRAEVAKAIAGYIGVHRSRTKEAMPDAEPHPVSGCCWKDVCAVAVIGSDKFGRQSQNALLKASHARRKNGIFK
jgi:predicted phosphoadenosine phosphosulfate sulfurtransferase